MADASGTADPRRRRLPWKGVAALGAVCASLFVVVQIWLRAEERNCEWECPLFPLVVVLLVLTCIVLICLVVLAVMVGIWAVRRTIDDADV